jgi:hypothetical protein
MNQDFLAPRMDLVPRMLAAAMAKAQSTEPVKIAKAMEDMQMDTVFGPVKMRGKDHQLLLPQVVNTIAPVDGKPSRPAGKARTTASEPMPSIPPSSRAADRVPDEGLRATPASSEHLKLARPHPAGDTEEGPPAARCRLPP